MGFMDKARQMAEQAEQKIDEAQKKFNEQQQQRSQATPEGPPVEYDRHGRFVPTQASEAPTQTVPPVEDPMPAPGPAPTAPPAAPRDAAQQEPNEPPKMSSGDPLAG